MNKKIILFVAVLALSAAVIAVAQSSVVLFNEVKNCETVYWDEIEKTYGTCTKSYDLTICDDPPINSSCHTETKSQDYVCAETNTVKHSKEICNPKSLEITKGTETGKIEFGEWGKCSTEEEANQLIVICDSRFDGNNDGVCQSGESCIKFTITENEVKRYLKNSQEEFTEDDESFFLEKLNYGVVSR